MNYRHLYHAGNFADVFKHIILIALTKSFLRKENAFCYLDTHAGIGKYDLSSEAAQKSKEYENGIVKILQAENPPELVQDYLKCINTLADARGSDLTEPRPSGSGNFVYPGSPEIVKHFLRPQDRMILCELHAEDVKILKKNYPHNKQIAIHHQDGYQSLKALLPPKERRGLILIDPPYENTNEFSHIISALSQALKRFETGVYAIWYPIKDRDSIVRFHRELKATISRPMLISELMLYPDNLATHLNGCGMLIINPPFQLDQQIEKILPWLWKTLSVNNQGSYILTQ